MGWLGRLFLVRRKWDAWLLTVGAAATPLRLGGQELAGIVFAGIGLYLALIGHRTARLFGNRFYFFALAYLVWVLMLAAVRAPESFDLREIGYAAIFFALVFIGPGLVLVRDPLRAYVVGARIGVAVSALLFLHYLAGDAYRLGGGGNPAPFALVVAILSMAAVIKVDRPPRFLPNSPLYVALGLPAIIASETRAVFVVAALFAFVELVSASRDVSRSSRIALLVAAVAVVVGLTLTKPIERVVELYDNYVTTDVGETSFNVRLEMWRAATQVASEHPLAGVGSTKMQKLQEASPQFADDFALYQHVHNFILDELLNHGVVGLVLMFAVLVGMGTQIWKCFPQTIVRRNLIFVAIVVVCYGMLHNPFLHETTLAAIFLYLGVLNASGSRRLMAEARRK